MASTKIINILKDDKFEEILDLFKNTPAAEVIFVLPKTSRAFKNEEHFIILGNEAEKSGKKVSLLCSNPDINELAKKYQFDVLLAKPSNTTSIYSPLTNKEKKQVTVEMLDNDNKSDEYQAVTVSKTNRGLERIVKQDGIPLKIALDKKQPVNLDVKKKPAYQPIDEIKNIWKKQSKRVQNENVWTGINNRTRKTFKNFPRKLLVGLGIISIILLGIIIYIATGSAKIDITPRKQPLDIQLKVSASDKFSSIDTGLNKIPGQLFRVEKSATQTFPTTGEKEVAQKARGKITVFNEYGTTPQVLIATTRFQTSDGFIFRTLKGITVPGTKVENGKIIPGSISVEVIADKPGQLYNILASKFNIPAFSERNDAGRYEKIYGRSNEAMKGGAIGKAKVITEADFSAAQQVLSNQVVKDVEDSFKIQTSGLKMIGSSVVKLKEPESTAKVDEAVDSFTMTISGSIKAVGFREDDLKNLVKQYVNRTKNLTIIPEKLIFDYADITLNEASDTLIFTININSYGYDNIDVEKIKIDLSGKNEKEIKDYFKRISGVGFAKIVLSPFWVKRIPSDKERTKIQINY